MSYLARYSDSELRAAYRAIDRQRVKSGRNKGCVSIRALRFADKLALEAKRRGAEFPHSWLAQVD